MSTYGKVAPLDIEAIERIAQIHARRMAREVVDAAARQVGAERMGRRLSRYRSTDGGC